MNRDNPTTFTNSIRNIVYQYIVNFYAFNCNKTEKFTRAFGAFTLYKIGGAVGGQPPEHLAPTPPPTLKSFPGAWLKGKISRLKSFECLFGINLSVRLFEPCELLAKLLQKTTMTASEANRGASVLLSTLEDMRHESCYRQPVCRGGRHGAKAEDADHGAEEASGVKTIEAVRAAALHCAKHLTGRPLWPEESLL